MPLLLGKSFEDQQVLVKRHIESKAMEFQGWRNFVTQELDPLADPRLESAGYQRYDGGVLLSKASQQQRQASKYLSARIPNIIENITARLTRAEIVIETLVGGITEPKTEREKKSMMERFFMGIIHDLNDQHQRPPMVLGSGWLRRVASSIAYPGKVIGRPWVKRVGKEAHFECPIYDPVNCYHDFDRIPFRFIHEVYMDTESVMDELERMNLPVPDRLLGRDAPKAVAYADYWLMERNYTGTGIDPAQEFIVWNGVAVDRLLVKGMEAPTDFKHLPHQIISVNTPTRVRSYAVPDGGVGDGDTPKSEFIDRHASPRFAKARHSANILNEAKSLEMKQMAFAVNPPKGFISEDGQWILSDQEWGPGKKIALTPDRTIQEIQLSNQSIEQNSVIVSAEGDIVDMYPRELLGGNPGDARSGYLYFLVTDQSEVAITDEVLAYSGFIKGTLKELAYQSIDNGLEVTLTGQSRTGETRGRLYISTFKASDMPKNWDIIVKTPPQLPKDELRSVRLFNEATLPGREMLSNEEAMMRFGNVQDPFANIERIRQQRIEASPEIQRMGVIEFFRQQRDLFRARSEDADNEDDRKYWGLQADAAEIYLRQWEQQILKLGPTMQPQQKNPIEPQVQPPEMRNNPDQAQQANETLPGQAL